MSYVFGSIRPLAMFKGVLGSFRIGMGGRIHAARSRATAGVAAAPAHPHKATMLFFAFLLAALAVEAWPIFVGTIVSFVTWVMLTALIGAA